MFIDLECPFGGVDLEVMGIVNELRGECEMTSFCTSPNKDLNLRPLLTYLATKFTNDRFNNPTRAVFPRTSLLKREIDYVASIHQFIWKLNNMD